MREKSSIGNFEMNPFADKKVAICHEWIDNIGGGEKVLSEIASNFVNPHIYTLWGDKQVGAELNLNYQETFMRLLPHKFRRNIGFIVMPLAWLSLYKKLKSYDLVVTSSWAFAHVCGKFNRNSVNYIHTPGRYWWNPDIDQRTRVKIPTPALSFLRILDSYFSRRHGDNIANSETTAERIKNYWMQSAIVINPPVDLDYFSINETKESVSKGFLLGVGRFVPYKNMSFIIKLGEHLGLPVVIAGHGPLYEALVEQAEEAKVDVLVINNPSNSEIRELYQSAKVLVYPAVEDFGIVPVEAMGCGLRVIGLNQGGLIETVEQGIGGSLVSTMDVKAFAGAISSLPDTTREQVRNSVMKFGKSSFNSRFQALICEKFDASVS
jgi:glycosyltransferase involved in cell wall biosynthesis